MALSNLKIIDCSRVVSGPYATMILADFGAHVLKVETIDHGDDARSYGPYREGESLYFANLNRNKHGMTLNLKSDEGKDIFLKLIEECDVLVENYRPGVMKSLGFDYETLSQINPRLIYASLSGFGQEGPYAYKPGYDIIAQAMGGLMSLTGQEDNPPTRAGNAIGDVLGGLNLTIGILAALNHRHNTGEGQHVDVALVDSVISSLENAFTRYHESQENPARIGNRYAAISPYDSFRAKDGYLIIACGNHELFKILATEVLNKPELINDDRFSDNQRRVDNQHILKEIIETHFKDTSSDEVMRLCENAKIPCSRINTLEDIVNDQHFVKAREMFVDLEHPVIGKMKVNGNPIKLSKGGVRFKKAAPLLSQDTNQVLADLGFNETEIQELKNKKVV